MTESKVQEFLEQKPGYRKSSKLKLAQKLKVSEALIQRVFTKLNKKTTLSTSIKRSTLRSKLMQSQGHLNQGIKQGKKVKKQWENQNLKQSQKLSQECAKGIHIVSGCWHFPFHNKEMYNGFCSLIKDLGQKIKGFHLLGDVLDMNSLSKHSKGDIGLPGVTLGMEYREGNKALDGFDKVLPTGIRKTYLWGNHEDRWNRHIKDVDNSKFADELASPTEALKLKERGYEVKENWKEDYFMLGKHLMGIHGEYCTKTPARTHMDKMKGSCIFVHTHRLDIAYDGEKAAFNIGWGGDINSPAFSYVSRITKLNWINGFAIVHIDEEGFFHTQVIPVYKNHFWFNGKQY